MAIKFWLFALVLLLTMGSALATQAEFAYVSTDAGSIYQYRITVNGLLQPLTPFRINVFDHPTQLALHPSGRFAYAVLVHEINSGHALAQVQGYRINANGTLNPLESQPLTLAAPADDVTMDPKGRFLFISGENDRLFTFRIQHNGTLTPLADNKDLPTFKIDTQGDGGGEATGTANWSSLTFDSTGRFLYVSTFLNGFDARRYEFHSYRLDQRGMLHSLKPYIYGQGEIDGCFSTPHGYLFVVHGYEGTYEYRINPHGLLTPASPLVLPKQFAILVTEGLGGETLWTDSPDPNGRGKDSLASYRISRTGRLIRKASHTGVWSWAMSLCANSSGRFFYGTEYKEGDYTHKSQTSLLAYAATPQGTLKSLAAPPQVEGRCISLCVTPASGRRGK